MSDVSASIGERLRVWRINRDWSQRRLADALTAAGAPHRQVTVHNIETGRRANITVEELLAIATVTNTDVSWWLPVHKGVTKAANGLCSIPNCQLHGEFDLQALRRNFGASRYVGDRRLVCDIHLAQVYPSLATLVAHAIAAVR